MTMVLLKDLLDYAQLKNGHFSIIKEYFDLTKTIQQVLVTNRRTAESKKIALQGPVFVKQEEKLFFSNLYGDSRRYFQILVNFVNNAIKFTLQNGTVSVILQLIDTKIIQDSNSDPVTPIFSKKKEGIVDSFGDGVF